ncbi:MAG: peptidylprolyl isomerase, partial [Myxococcota bacterium]|nr:peptidylprolyl isomerase [Myxococcota bacterium]
MLALLLSFVSYANPLSCKDIQEMESQEKPLFEIQRSIQQNGMQEGVRACLERKSLSRLIPKPDQDQIAPDLYTVRFSTTKGDFLARFERAWAPTGNDRFYTLVQNGFYQDIAFFRAIRGFMLQFGIHGDPIQTQTWSSKPISD